MCMYVHVWRHVTQLLCLFVLQYTEVQVEGESVNFTSIAPNEMHNIYNWQFDDPPYSWQIDETGVDVTPIKPVYLTQATMACTVLKLSI